MTINVICLTLDNGKVAPLAWTKADLSVKELRRIAKGFKDTDVTGCETLPWGRLYNSIEEVKSELKEY